MATTAVKPRIYVETSVISYLTARPSRDLITAGRQQGSLELWRSQDRYELVISDLVLAEASAGDAQAASQRRAWLQNLHVLGIDDDAQALADALIARNALPAVAYPDALHIAIAASNAIEVIASWNFRHIASVWARSRIETALSELGYAHCRIATPDELIEGEPQ
jgi:predicted nucleic acid-binding protein